MSESTNREPLLEVRNLKVTFGSKRHPFPAVNDVSFDIYPGETFGLVGNPVPGKPLSAVPSSALIRFPAEKSAIRGRPSVGKFQGN